MVKKKYICVIIGLMTLFTSCTRKGYWDGDVYVAPSEVTNLYNMPDISSTILIIDDIKFGIGVEICDRRMTPIDLQFFEHNIGISVSHRWTSVYEVKTGLYYGYSFDDKEFKFGAVFSLSN